MSSPRSLIFDTKTMRVNEDYVKQRTMDTMLALIHSIEREEQADRPSMFVLELRPLLEAFLGASFHYMRDLELEIEDLKTLVSDLEAQEWERASLEDLDTYNEEGGVG